MTTTTDVVDAAPVDGGALIVDMVARLAGLVYDTDDGHIWYATPDLDRPGEFTLTEYDVTGINRTGRIAQVAVALRISTTRETPEGTR
jgi:hypothetical protein